MTLLVKNTTSGNLVDIDNIQMLGIQKGPVHTGANGFTIVVYHHAPMMGQRVGYKLAEFSKEEDAKACLEIITAYKCGVCKVNETAPYYLTVDDKVEASILELPGNGLDKNLIK